MYDTDILQRILCINKCFSATCISTSSFCCDKFMSFTSCALWLDTAVILACFGQMLETFSFNWQMCMDMDVAANTFVMFVNGHLKCLLLLFLLLSSLITDQSIFLAQFVTFVNGHLKCLLLLLLFFFKPKVNKLPRDFEKKIMKQMKKMECKLLLLLLHSMG